MKNEKPLYLARNLEINSVKAMGKTKGHITLMVRGKSPVIRKMIGWNYCSGSADPNWCEILKAGDLVDIVFDIGVNEWNGNRELQFTIKDIKKSDK